MNNKQIIEQNDSNVMPTYSRFPVAVVRGKGAEAFDADGKGYIDFTSGIGVNSLGYADEGWVKAISEQAGRIQHISNLYYNDQTAALAERLCSLTGFGGVFFSNSGAEANECAIKLARKYSFDKYGAGRNGIVSLLSSFHGRTMATLTATGQDGLHQYFFPFNEGFRYAEAGNIDDLINKAGDDTCAVMMELIQGEGGVIPQAPDFVKAVERLCRERDILLIIDEVQTGIGRTGTLLACEGFGIKPDIVTLAKGLGGGLPIGACLCSDALSKVMTAGTHGTTFGGNPVVCAGANYVLSRVADPEFLESVSQNGEYIRARLKKMPNVAEVRGRGLMIGIVLEKGEARSIAEKCVENGLLILTAKTLLRLLPPLNITRDETDRGLDILEKVLSTVEQG